jgi:hypothetical protein
VSETLICRIKTHIASSGGSLPFPAVSESVIARAEAEIGFALPTLLKLCYVEVGNGGFGPERGVIGIEGGHPSDYGNIVQTNKRLNRDMATLERKWEPGVLPFCAWGCAVLSCVKCDTTTRIWTYDNAQLWPQEYSLADFFELWIAGIDILSRDAALKPVEQTIRNPFTGRQETTTTWQHKEGKGG